MSNGNMQWPYAGLGHAPSYQVSGIPFLTTSTNIPGHGGTPLKISFPYVTKEFTVHLVNKNEQLKIGLSLNGVQNSNYYLLDSTNPAYPSVTLNTKCNEIYLIGGNGTTLTASVFASLTAIPTSELANSGPNGNNWSGSLGVG